MAVTLRRDFASICRTTRLDLDVSLAQLGRAAGIAPAHIAAIEAARANPSMDVLERLADALGVDVGFAVRPPVVMGGRQRDLVHARMSAYAQRRLESQGWTCRREVEVIDGRFRGWIDLLALDPIERLAVILEFKSVIDDVGGTERQLALYERSAPSLLRRLGLRADRVLSCLILLASDEVEVALLSNAQAMRLAFPLRARQLRPILDREGPGADRSEMQLVARGAHGAHETVSRPWRGLALIDPSRRGRSWLIPSRMDGRSGPSPYRDYADAAARWRGPDGSTRVLQPGARPG